MRECSRAVFCFWFFFFSQPWEDKKVNSFIVFSLEKLGILAVLWDALREPACPQS